MSSEGFDGTSSLRAGFLTVRCDVFFKRYGFGLTCLFSFLWFALYPLLVISNVNSDKDGYYRMGADFGQYYTGALVARHGLWDQLYPVAKKQVYDNTPVFEPEFAKKIFYNLTHGKNKWSFSYYGTIASPDNSIVSKNLQDIYPKLQDDWHYIYPPPLAILLWPLAFFDFEGALYVWYMILSASLFGVGVVSSLIYRSLGGNDILTSCLVVALPGLIQFYLYLNNNDITFAIGNSSPFLGFLISVAAYSWIKNKQLLSGVCMIPLLLFKGMGLGWCLLLLSKPIRAKTIITMAMPAFLLISLSLVLGGFYPYRVFFLEIIPKANVALGMGLQGQLLQKFGIDIKGFMLLVGVALYGALYLGYLKRLNEGIDSAELSLIAIAGTMMVFVICNPIVWPHYYICYLVYPFIGGFLYVYGKYFKYTSIVMLIIIVYAFVFSRFSLDYLNSGTGVVSIVMRKIWETIVYIFYSVMPFLVTIAALSHVYMLVYGRKLMNKHV